MSSTQTEKLTAEEKFRAAFERLKTNEPKVLERDTPVTQNNVAREAGCDPSALKKTRFPLLVRQIQEYVELHSPDAPPSATRKLGKQRAANRTLQQRLDDTIRQRDKVQSIVASANERIIELTIEVQGLREQLDELRPTVTLFGKR